MREIKKVLSVVLCMCFAGTVFAAAIPVRIDGAKSRAANKALTLRISRELEAGRYGRALQILENIPICQKEGAIIDEEDIPEYCSDGSLLSDSKVMRVESRRVTVKGTRLKRELAVISPVVVLDGAFRRHYYSLYHLEPQLFTREQWRPFYDIYNKAGSNANLQRFLAGYMIDRWLYAKEPRSIAEDKALERAYRVGEIDYGKVYLVMYTNRNISDFIQRDYAFFENRALWKQYTSGLDHQAKVVNDPAPSIVLKQHICQQVLEPGNIPLDIKVAWLGDSTNYFWDEFAVQPFVATQEMKEGTREVLDVCQAEYSNEPSKKEQCSNFQRHAVRLGLVDVPEKSFWDNFSGMLKSAIISAGRSLETANQMPRLR